MGHGSRGAGLWRRYGGVPGESFEVPGGRGEEKLIAGAGEAPQPELRHRGDVFGLTEQRFDSLALDTGNPIGLGFHQGLGVVTGLLADIARDSPFPAGSALGLERTAGTVAAFGDVFDGNAVMNGARGFQFFAAGTDIEIALFVIGKAGRSSDLASSQQVIKLLAGIGLHEGVGRVGDLGLEIRPVLW